MLGRNCSIAGSPLLCTTSSSRGSILVMLLYTTSTLVMLLISTPPPSLNCNVHCALLCFSPLHHLPFSLHGLLILKPTNRTLIFFIQCSVFLLESFSIFCIQYHFLNSMQYFSFENFLCFASNFSLMYNHNRRLVLVKKLLSHNNKNIICCILTKQCIYYLLHPSEK